MPGAGRLLKQPGRLRPDPGELDDERAADHGGHGHPRAGVRPVLGAGQGWRADGRECFNVNLVYSSPDTTNPQAQASLITKAAAQHPKGLVVTIPDAAVLSGPIKQAASAGIPVIVMNVGANV